MNRLKLVADTSPYWHYTLNCMMSSISSAGLGGVELWLASPHYCYVDAPEQNAARRRELKELLRQNRLEVPVFSSEQMVKYPWNIPTLAAYIKDTDRENILAAVTLLELAEAGLDIPGCVELFGGKLGHVYLEDRGGKIPGSTGEEMEGYLRALEAANFSGFVSVQISFQDCILTPDRWLRESARWLQKKKFL